jgi:hypothetical protein
VPDGSDAIMFGVFLIGRGRIELRNAELIRSTWPSADGKTSPDHGVQAIGPASQSDRPRHRDADFRHARRRMPLRG